MTSYTGLRGNPGQSNYAMAKAGIIGFTKTTAKELARFGTTVNAISPNAQTRMIASVPPGKLAELTAAIPMGRFADAVRDGRRGRVPGLRRGRLHHRRGVPGRRRTVTVMPAHHRRRTT